MEIRNQEDSSNPSSDKYPDASSKDQDLDRPGELLTLPLDEFIVNVDSPYNDIPLNDEYPEKDKSPVKSSNPNVANKSEKNVLRYKPNINVNSRAGLGSSLNNVDTTSASNATLHNDISQRPSSNTKDQESALANSHVSDETPEDTINDDIFQEADDTTPLRHKPKYTLHYTPKIANQIRQETVSQPHEELLSKNGNNLDTSVNYVCYHIIYYSFIGYFIN